MLKTLKIKGSDDWRKIEIKQASGDVFPVDSLKVKQTGFDPMSVELSTDAGVVFSFEGYADIYDNDKFRNREKVSIEGNSHYPGDSKVYSADGNLTFPLNFEFELKNKVVEVRVCY